MEDNELWNKFLDKINDSVSTMTYNTWFKPLNMVKIENDEIFILDPGKVVKDQLINFYNDLIEETLLDLTGKSMILKYINQEDIDKINNKKDFSPDEIINQEDKVERLVERRKTNLNPKYQFDNFVVGESNRFAFSTSVSVAQNPGKLYNPLFLYGKSGLGKTHLMHAIGNYITDNSNLKVLFITSDEFMNEFVSISKNKGDKDENISYIELFKKKYRDVDVLLIDDIQFLGNATSTQQEFTNTFNSLYYNEKQIIISSDRSVNDLKLFEDRLKTRFNWGLKAIIDVPEYDLKVKIIKNKIKGEDLMMDLSDEIINFIASNCGNDIRNLEGSIIRLYAYRAMMGLNEIKLSDAMEALDEYANGNGTFTNNSIGKIISVVASYFDLKVDDIKGKKRSKEIANARMIAMYLCRILTEETYPRIGLEFGGKDHSTVIHGYEKISEDIKTNPELEKIISELKVKMSE